MTIYRFEISGELESDLTLKELQWRIDIWLLKYDVNEIIPEWDKQSISLEWYEVIDFDTINIEQLWIED